MKDTFSKILSFINDNRLLSFIVILAILLILPVIFSKNISNVDVTNTSDIYSSINNNYSNILENESFIYFKFKENYYVIVKDMTTQDKEKIRQYLKIPNNIDFEVIVQRNLDPVSRTDIYEQQLTQ